MEYKEKTLFPLTTANDKNSEIEEYISEVDYDGIEKVYDDSKKITSYGETSMRIFNFISKSIDEFCTDDNSASNIYNLFLYIKIIENLFDKCDLLKIGTIMKSLLEKCQNVIFENQQDKFAIFFCMYASIIKFIERFPSAGSFFKELAIDDARKIEDESIINQHRIKFIATVYKNCEVEWSHIAQFINTLTRFQTTLLMDSYIIKLFLKLAVQDSISDEYLDAVIGNIVNICNNRKLTQIIPKTTNDILELINIYLKKNPDLDIFKKKAIVKIISKFKIDKFMDSAFSILEIFAKNPTGIETKLAKCVERIGKLLEFDKLSDMKIKIIEILLNGQEMISDEICKALTEYMDAFPLHTLVHLAEKLNDIVPSLEEYDSSIVEMIDTLLENLEEIRDLPDGETRAHIYIIGDKLNEYLQEMI